MKDSTETPEGHIKRKLLGPFASLSLRGKAVLFVIPVIILISAAYTLIAVNAENRILRNEIIRKGESIVALAARNAELPVLSENIEQLRKASSSLKALTDISFVAFDKKNFEPLFHDAVPADVRLSNSVSQGPEVSFFDHDRFLEFVAPVYTVRLAGEIEMFQSEPAAASRELIGWARIGISKEVMNRSVDENLKMGVLLALILSSVGGVLAYILITLATKPLNALSVAVKEVRAGEYPEIEVIKSTDEVGRLSEEFNKMSRAIKEREYRIKSSEMRIKSLFERVEHAIFRLDKEGNITETNKKFDEFCAGAASFRDLFPDVAKDSCMQKASSGKLKNLEEKILDRNSREMTVVMSIYPELDEKGGPANYDGYFLDVTEKKHLEETLIQSQKLESIGLLAGGIAHDFNNILTGIVGYSSLLKMTINQDDKNYGYIDAIEKSGLRAANLTKQLLGFARKGKYRVEKLNVNDIVRELVSFLKETIDRRIELIVETDPQLSLVDGDSTQLYQALMNLCINARDAMQDGGRIYIKTDLCALTHMKSGELFQVPAGEYVRISVTDTGIGMPAEVKRRIFEPFYSTKETGKGTGLGLAMVYGIVKNHGGYISVYSEIGLGTTLRIYLPKAVGIRTEAKGDLKIAQTSKKGSILIIDDEPTVRDLGRDILEKHEFNVVLAKNGSEGISLYRQYHKSLDLVILDMIMPDKSGREVFREICAINPSARILLCSGYGDDHAFKELLDAGALGIIQKPFQHSELIDKISAALDEQSV